jgi:hypothetical protein
MGKTTVVIDVAINGIIEFDFLKGTKTEREYERLKSRLDFLNYIEYQKD